jgi:hypothetical protein
MQQTVRPFCSVFRGRFGTAVVIEQRNNQLLVSTFPLLDKYNAARSARTDTEAYFSARKLDAVNRELSDNLDHMLGMITAERISVNGPPSEDAMKTAHMQAKLGEIYAHQRQAQQALAQFVGEALYAVQEDLRDLQGHAAPVAAISMPDLPQLIRANISDANDSEQRLRPLVQQAAKQCS